MDRQRNRQLSQRKNDKYNALILSGMEIPDSVYTQKKAQENQSKMAETPVPSLILSLSVSGTYLDKAGEIDNGFPVLHDFLLSIVGAASRPRVQRVHKVQRVQRGVVSPAAIIL